MYKIQADQEAASREKMIEKYNEKSRPTSLLEGDFVYINEPVPRDEKTRKLAPHWRGPFVIEEVASPHSLRLRDPTTHKELPSLIHVDRVKKCWADPETVLGLQPAGLDHLRSSACSGNLKFQIRC